MTAIKKPEKTVSKRNGKTLREELKLYDPGKRERDAKELWNDVTRFEADDKIGEIAALLVKKGDWNTLDALAAKPMQRDKNKYSILITDREDTKSLQDALDRYAQAHASTDLRSALETEQKVRAYEMPTPGDEPEIALDPRTGKTMAAYEEYFHHATNGVLVIDTKVLQQLQKELGVPQIARGR